MQHLKQLRFLAAVGPEGPSSKVRNISGRLGIASRTRLVQHGGPAGFSLSPLTAGPGRQLAVNCMIRMAWPAPGLSGPIRSRSVCGPRGRSGGQHHRVRIVQVDAVAVPQVFFPPKAAVYRRLH